MKDVKVVLDSSFVNQLTEIHQLYNHKWGFQFKARIIPRFLDLKSPPALPMSFGDYYYLTPEEKRLATAASQDIGGNRRYGKFRDKLNVFMSHPVETGMTCNLRSVGPGSIYLDPIVAEAKATLILTTSLSGKNCVRTVYHRVNEEIIVHRFHRETATGIHWNDYYLAAVPIGHTIAEFVSTHDTSNHVVTFNFERA